MLRTMNTRIGYLSKMFFLILIVAIIGLCVLPAGSVFAGEENDEDVVVAAEEEFEGPGAITIVPPDAPVIDEPVIEDEPTPLAAPEEPVVHIPPERPPLASFATWALFNLIMTIATGIIMAFLLINYFRRLKDEFKGDAKKANKHLALRLVMIAATSVAVILFVTTQNMRLPMGLLDQWTILHVAILAATIVLAALSVMKQEEADAVSKKA